MELYSLLIITKKGGVIMAQWSKDEIIKQVEQTKSNGKSKAALSQFDYQEVNA